MSHMSQRNHALEVSTLLNQLNHNLLVNAHSQAELLARLQLLQSQFAQRTFLPVLIRQKCQAGVLGLENQFKNTSHWQWVSLSNQHQILLLATHLEHKVGRLALFRKLARVLQGQLQMCRFSNTAQGKYIQRVKIARH